jgi:Tol biopolymer transport system component
LTAIPFPSYSPKKSNPSINPTNPIFISKNPIDGPSNLAPAMNNLNLNLDKFDRYVLTIIVVVILAIGGLVAYGDHVGVQIIEYSPTDGQPVSAGSNIRIEFDQAMEQDSVEERFALNPDVNGSFRWQGNAMTFAPNRDFLPNHTYEVILRKGAKSTSGRELNEAQRWSFSIEPAFAYYLSPANARIRSLWGVSAGSEPYEVFAPENGVHGYEPRPDGRRLAVTVFDESSFTTNIWLIDPDGSNPVQLTDCAPGACQQPTWSPDGNFIAYEKLIPAENGALGPSRIWVYNTLNGNDSSVYQDSQVLGYGAIWSPVGATLSFFDANISAIRLIDLSTGTDTSIETQLSELWAFSPDGNTLVFSDLWEQDRQYYSRLLVKDLTSDAEAVPLLTDNLEDRSPAWSPTSDWLAFGRRTLDWSESVAWQLVVYNPDSKEFRQLTFDSDYTNRDFRWYPDGEYIIFQRFRLGSGSSDSEIWMYDVKTDELTFLASDAFNPQWLPAS